MWLMKKMAVIFKNLLYIGKEWLTFTHKLGKNFGKINNIFTKEA